jgi:hypothetical protein
MSLVENIKHLCDQRGTSIPKLEKHLGFGHGAIYKWDKNSPSVANVQKVAAHFKTSIRSILWEMDSTEAVKTEGVTWKERQPVSTHSISRIDADDSRLLKKEFLRLIRVRASILRTLYESDQAAIDIAGAAASRKDEGFESDIEGLIWKYVAMRLEYESQKAESRKGEPS